MIKSYEAIVAISIISLALILFFKDHESYREEVDFKKIFSILKWMDLKEELRNYVMTNNSEEIEKRISYQLPGYDIIVQICDLNCSKLSTSEEYYSITYLISGNLTSFNPKQLIVYVMR